MTGLQTFPDAYETGIPLSTQSEWGWHSFPNPEGYELTDALKNYDHYGREVPYASNQDSVPQASGFERIPIAWDSRALDLNSPKKNG